MARFTVRIELHHGHQNYDHPNHPVYSFLNHSMEAKGFSLSIESGGLKQLPRAEYIINGDFSCSQVLRVAKQVCETTERDYSIVVFKTLECLCLGLKPVTQTLKTSKGVLSKIQAQAFQNQKITETIEEKQQTPSTTAQPPLVAVQIPASLEVITANLQKTRACLDGIVDVVERNRAVIARARATMDRMRIDNPNYISSVKADT